MARKKGFLVYLDDDTKANLKELAGLRGEGMGEIARTSIKKAVEAGLQEEKEETVEQMLARLEGVIGSKEFKKLRRK